MTNIKLVLGALLLLGVVIFSLQNAEVVAIRFLAWQFSTSLALVIFSSLAAGLVGGWAVGSALRFKRRRQDLRPCSAG